MLVQGRPITEFDPPGTHKPIRDVLNVYDSPVQAPRWLPRLYLR